MLGTGGLVRAYTGASEAALAKAEIVQKARGYEAKIVINYTEFEPLKYYLDKSNIKITKIDYLEQIELIIDIKQGTEKQFLNNYNNNKFNISKFDIIKEKNVEI